MMRNFKYIKLIKVIETYKDFVRLVNKNLKKILHKKKNNRNRNRNHNHKKNKLQKKQKD